MEAQGEVKHNGRKEGGGEWKINKVRRHKKLKSDKENAV